MAGPVRQDYNFIIDSAHQGQEGLEMVRRAIEEGHPYAMAFVDMRMPPGWNGLDTIARIWKEYPELQVVICTAYSDHSWDEIVERLGCTDQLLILKKPFDNVEVRQLVYALTEKWHLAQKAKLKTQELMSMVRSRTQDLENRAPGAFGNQRTSQGSQMGGRRGQPLEDDVSGQYEPRNSHAHDRHHRIHRNHPRRRRTK